MMSLSRFTLLLIVSLLLTVPLFAQSAAPVTGTISGHVYMADGVTPVPNALIHLRTDEIQHLIVFDGQADAIGRFQIAVPPGSYEVIAEGMGLGLVWYISPDGVQIVTVSAGQTITGIDIRLPHGNGSISGQVVAPDGTTPLPNTLVQLLRLYAFERSHYIQFQSYAGVETDANGEFAFGLPDGTYLLQAFPYEYLSQFYPSGDQYSGQRLVITNGNSISGLHFVMSSGNGFISGRVTAGDGVTPLSAVPVRARDSSNYYFGGAAETDMDGQYRISVQPGRYNVSVMLGNSASAWWVDYGYETPQGWSYVDVAAGQTVTGIDITTPAYGTISGRITLADGAPLTSQPISVYGDLLTLPTDMGLTGEQAESLSAKIGAQLDQLESAYGFVVAMEQITPWGITYWGPNIVAPLQADGSYQLDLQPGQYRVRAFVGGYGRKYYGETYAYDLAANLELVAEAALTGIDMTLDPAGSISGVVRAPNGTSIPYPHFELMLAQYDNYIACGDANGVYTIPDVPLNVPLTLTLRGATNCAGAAQNYARQSTPITLSAGQPHHSMDFTLPLAAMIMGRVTYAPNGLPIANASVYASSLGNDQAQGQSDADGYYTLIGVPIDTPVQVIANGSSYYPATLTLTSGETRTNIDIAVSATTLPKLNLYQPTGSIGSNSPFFEWSQQYDASWYYLWVSGQTGLVFDGWFSWDTACLDYSCYATPLTNLPPGHYTWWVQGWSEVYGYSEWSDPLTFNVPYSAAPTPTAPIGAVSESSATFAWTGLPNVLWYQVWISTPDGSGIERWYNAFDICAANVCAAPDPLDLNAGIYTWWVRGWNYGLYTPWSAATYFALPLPAPTQVAPSGTISAPPLFTWNALPGADWYYLWLSDANGKVMHEWYDAASHCAGLTCTLTLPVTWHEGGYTWWLQAWSPVTGYGAWSPGTGFAYDDPLVPITAPEVVPTLIPLEEPPPEELPPVPDLPPDAPPSDF
ncbi:MAG: carboxypeptidase regulatory-like domain-containing protein [Anaerolinea sp.]|nr:carboxypeptidase regulatory-like domain-containing protein [Anaerolinea sp.]